jgi:dsRNA-specific ribonuclease
MERNIDLYNMVSNISINAEECVNPYNENNKLIKIDDIKFMFSKFDMKVEPKDINFYINALTHKSYIKKEYYDVFTNQLSKLSINKNPKTLELLDQSNERLEFLGDTVIKCVVSGYLFTRFQYEDEGFMTRLKTKIENRQSLARFARILGLDEYMLISKQIEDNKENGRNSDKLLEDCFESFVGALYLDVGFEVCRNFMYVILETEIEYSEILYKDTNYKDQLLRFYHQNKWTHPQYVQINENTQNKRMFVMGVKDHNGNIVAQGKALSKQKAEQIASMLALHHYNVIKEDQMMDINEN